MALITFAHRGARAERPENTIPAFQRALELGARGLETDAWLSKDGEVVLVHDDRVRRGIRRVKVAEATAAELAELDVPRLADLYETCGTDFELSIDCKEEAAARPMIEVARAAGGGAPSRLWLCSPRRTILRSLRDDAPDVKLVHSPGLMPVPPAAMERYTADLAATGIDCVNLHHTEWSMGLVALAHRFELRAFAWDTQEVRTLRAVMRMHIDGVYCDRVDRMVGTVSEWAEDDAV